MCQSRVRSDTIYANNEARKYCTENGITTCFGFVRKGSIPKEDSVDDHTARRIPDNLRATVMEGSFVYQKQRYGLVLIAARNCFSETLPLFFGIHMANAATLAARKLATETREKVKRRA